MKIIQTSSFLLSKVHEVAAGRVLPAAMQRPYVWSKTDVEALCHSILLGYPIGGFLEWSPKAGFDLSKVAKGRLGPIAASATDDHRWFSLLLDGQNRLATLAWMMRKITDQAPVDPSPAEQATWLGDEVLVLDYTSRSVIFVPKSEAATGLRLPAWTLVAGPDANSFVRSLLTVWEEQFTEKEVEDFTLLWDRARDKFKDARTTETVITDASPEQARHAFMHICRVGVAMSTEDFDRALNWNAELFEQPV